MRHKREVFPAGLYGMLLFALCCLTLPAVFAPIERWLVGTAALLPRALVVWTGSPASAADAGVGARLAELGADLQQRVAVHDTGRAPAQVREGHEPLLCGVVATGRRGGGGKPSELRLARSYAELADCSDFVTKGNVLVGFLLRPGRGAAADDAPDDPARVVLLNHPSARSVAAVADLPAGGFLRMVVRASASVDPYPLRVELWDDPYRAARLDRGGSPVSTLALPSVPDSVPGGLWLGRTRIWGYEGQDGQPPLTIGVFVVPPIEPLALSHVVVWRRADRNPAVVEPSATAEPARHQPATVWELPGAAHGRHLLATDGAVPDGAAVVQDGWCLGTAHGLSFGLGLVTSFAASRQRWSLLLLPEAPAARPHEISGEVIEGRNGEALLRWRGDTFDGEGRSLPAGYLFTGSNGPHCPPGLYLGRATPHRFEPDLIEVATSPPTGLPASGPRAAEIVVGGGLR